MSQIDNMSWSSDMDAVICSTFMIHKRKYYSPFQLVSAVLMICALLWLTVSTPFVFESKQRIAAAKEQKAATAQAPMGSEEQAEEEANPFGNTTEEKAPSSSVNTMTEEYLHNNHSHYHIVSVIESRSYAHRNAGTYVAFHGELLVPPPNQA